MSWSWINVRKENNGRSEGNVKCDIKECFEERWEINGDIVKTANTYTGIGRKCKFELNLSFCNNMNDLK